MNMRIVVYECNSISFLKIKERGGGALHMKNVDIPVWEKYTLTIEEVSVYFRIGEKKLRRLVDEHRNASWLITNGNRIQIKRKQFEKIIDELEEI